jgi:hypothetical protein
MSSCCIAFQAVDPGTTYANCLKKRSYSSENIGNVIEPGSFDDFAADNVAPSRKVDDTCSSLGSPKFTIDGEVIKRCDDKIGSRADVCVLSRNGDMAVSVCIAGTRIL